MSEMSFLNWFALIFGLSAVVFLMLLMFYNLGMLDGMIKRLRKPRHE